MKPGDMIQIETVWEGSTEESYTGLLLEVLHVDETAKVRKDNFSRWMLLKILVGDTVKVQSIYWDDMIQVVG